jgi:hypothetical protein
MALGTPTSRATGTSAGTATTGSFTVPSGDLIFVARGLRGSAAQPSSFTISDSLGLTWNSLGDQAYRPATIGMRLQVWWAQSTGSAMTVTLTTGATGANQGRTDIVSISGVDTASLTNKAFATNASGAPSVSLPSAPAGSSTVLAFFMGSGSVTVPPPTSYTEIDEVGAATAILESGYIASSASQTVAYNVSGDGESIAFALELVAASVSGITGTASITEAADTVSAAGTVALAAAASITEAADTVSSAGTVALSGAAAIAEAADTVSAVGTAALAAVAAITEAADTVSAAGALAIAGAASPTEAADTLDATGAVVGPVTGSAAILEASDTVLAVAVKTGWGPVAGATGDWTPVATASGSWNGQSATGTWSSVPGANGIWTDVPDASGSWS